MCRWARNDSSMLLFQVVVTIRVTDIDEIFFTIRCYNMSSAQMSQSHALSHCTPRMASMSL